MSMMAICHKYTGPSIRESIYVPCVAPGDKCLGYRSCDAPGIVHHTEVAQGSHTCFKMSSNHPLLWAGKAVLGRHRSLMAVLYLLWPSG